VKPGQKTPRERDEPSLKEAKRRHSPSAPPSWFDFHHRTTHVSGSGQHSRSGTITWVPHHFHLQALELPTCACRSKSPTIPLCLCRLGLDICGRLASVLFPPLVVMPLVRLGDKSRRNTKISVSSCDDETVTMTAKICLVWNKSRTYGRSVSTLYSHPRCVQEIAAHCACGHHRVGTTGKNLFVSYGTATQLT